MSIAIAANALFFAPAKEFLSPKKEPGRGALPQPTPPREGVKEKLGEKLTRFLLAMDPILFMASVLLTVSIAVTGLWFVMGVLLPL